MKLRSLLSPPGVVAVVALFVALGATSYAAIVVTGKNVRDRSLSGRDIKRNSIRGSEVKEGTLATVPSARRAGVADRAQEAESAANATNAVSATSATSAQTADRAAVATQADSVNGHVLASIDGQVTTAQSQTVLELGGLKLELSCSAADGVVVTATTATSDARLHASATQANNTVKETEDEDFDVGESHALNEDTTEGTMTLHYRRGSGGDRRVVSASLAFDDTGLDCFAYGHATMS